MLDFFFWYILKAVPHMYKIMTMCSWVCIYSVCKGNNDEDHFVFKSTHYKQQNIQYMLFFLRIIYTHKKNLNPKSWTCFTTLHVLYTYTFSCAVWNFNSQHTRDYKCSRENREKKHPEKTIANRDLLQTRCKYCPCALQVNFVCFSHCSNTYEAIWCVV